MVAVFTIFVLVSREDLRDRFIHLASGGRLNVMTQALDEAANAHPAVFVFAIGGECRIRSSGGSRFVPYRHPRCVRHVERSYQSRVRDERLDARNSHFVPGYALELSADNRSAEVQLAIWNQK